MPNLTNNQKTFFEASIIVLSKYGETGTALQIKQLVAESDEKRVKEKLKAKHSVTITLPDDVEVTKLIPLDKDDEDILTQTIKYLKELSCGLELHNLKISLARLKKIKEVVKVESDEDDLVRDNVLKQIKPFSPPEKMVDLPKELIDGLAKITLNKDGDVVEVGTGKVISKGSHITNEVLKHISDNITLKSEPTVSLSSTQRDSQTVTTLQNSRQEPTSPVSTVITPPSTTTVPTSRKPVISKDVIVVKKS